MEDRLISILLWGALAPPPEQLRVAVLFTIDLVACAQPFFVDSVLIAISHGQNIHASISLQNNVVRVPPNPALVRAAAVRLGT